MSTPLKVVLADDHPMMLGGLEALLKHADGFAVVSVASNGVAALESIRAFAPEIAILDISMPGLTGLQVLQAVVAEALPTRVVFLTASAAEDDVMMAIRHGAWGILLKNAAPEILVQCLRGVARGHRWPVPALSQKGVQGASNTRPDPDKFELLTTREREVALLVATGLSNKEIARRISVSEGTVRIHLYNAYQKLEVGNRTSLASMAHGFLDGQRRYLT